MIFNVKQVVDAINKMLDYLRQKEQEGEWNIVIDSNTNKDDFLRPPLSLMLNIGQSVNNLAIDLIAASHIIGKAVDGVIAEDAITAMIVAAIAAESFKQDTRKTMSTLPESKHQEIVRMMLVEASKSIEADLKNFLSLANDEGGNTNADYLIIHGDDVVTISRIISDAMRLRQAYNALMGVSDITENEGARIEAIFNMKFRDVFLQMAQSTDIAAMLIFANSFPTRLANGIDLVPTLLGMSMIFIDTNGETDAMEAFGFVANSAWQEDEMPQNVWGAVKTAIQVAGHNIDAGVLDAQTMRAQVDDTIAVGDLYAMEFVTYAGENFSIGVLWQTDELGELMRDYGIFRVLLKE